jgi:hypothetical protein
VKKKWSKLERGYTVFVVGLERVKVDCGWKLPSLLFVLPLLLIQNYTTVVEAPISN